MAKHIQLVGRDPRMEQVLRQALAQPMPPPGGVNIPQMEQVIQQAIILAPVEMSVEVGGWGPLGTDKDKKVKRLVIQADPLTGPQLIVEFEGGQVQRFIGIPFVVNYVPPKLAEQEGNGT